MKKKSAVAALLLLVIATALAGAAFATNPLRLFVNGREIKPEITPQLIKGHLIAPVREVAEALGASIQWNEKSRAVIVTSKKPAPSTGGLTGTSYYPKVPEKITSPEMALQAYFDALSNASNLTPEQMAATGGTAGMAQEPYPTAHGYWSKDWQAKHSYDEFLASWQGTAHLDLLKLLPAGQENGRPRFFVEIKTSEVAGGKPHLGVFYYAGFFTAAQTAEEWRITGGRLDPEKFDFGGHQPWHGDPEAVAQAGVGNSIDAPLGKAVLENNADGTVKVKFMTAGGEVNHWAMLVHKENGRWQVIDKQ